MECKALYPHIIHFKPMLVSLIICLMHSSFQLAIEEIGHSITVQWTYYPIKSKFEILYHSLHIVYYIFREGVSPFCTHPSFLPWVYFYANKVVINTGRRKKSSVDIAELEIQVKRKKVENNNHGTWDGLSGCPGQVTKVFFKAHNIFSFLAQQAEFDCMSETYQRPS